MSRVRVNEAAINRFFARNPLAGTGAGGGVRGTGNVDRIAARMITFVKAEIRKDFNERSGELLESLRPIIKPDPRGGVRVGVGSVSKTAEYLTEGTQPHPISVPIVNGRPAYSLRSNGPNSKGYNPTPLRQHPIYFVNHPGNKANNFIRRGVNLAIGRPLP